MIGTFMNDERCCGTGTCIINAEGLCWCGQKWNGSTICFPEAERHNDTVAPNTVASPGTSRGPQAISPTPDLTG
jgi:hypothetical protein